MGVDHQDAASDYGSDIDLDDEQLLLLLDPPSAYTLPTTANFADEVRLHDAGNDGDAAVAIVYPTLPQCISVSPPPPTDSTRAFSQESNSTEDADSQYFECTEAIRG